MAAILSWPQCVNTLRPQQHIQHFVDDIFKCTSLKESCYILIQILLKIVCKSSIDSMSALVHIITQCQTGSRPLPKPLLNHWVFMHIDGLLQDCSNSIANALELLQSCTNPSICITSLDQNWHDHRVCIASFSAYSYFIAYTIVPLSPPWLQCSMLWSQ